MTELHGGLQISFLANNFLFHLFWQKKYIEVMIMNDYSQRRRKGGSAPPTPSWILIKKNHKGLAKREQGVRKTHLKDSH